MKINKKENSNRQEGGRSENDSLKFKSSKNLVGLETLDSTSAMKLKKTFSQWKARMKQLMEFDNLPLYKSIFDYVKGYEDKLLGLKLDEGEIADKVMKFWLLPVIDTSKEKYTDFEVKRESSNRIQLVLEHCHSAELKAKPFEVDLDLDFEMKEALGLNNTSELERRGQPSNTNFKLNKIMQLVTNSIYKKFNQESPKEYAKSVAVEKADVSVQVDVPRILTPLSQPPPIERLYTPRKQEQVYSPSKHNGVSSFSDVKYNQYRTLDNYNRRAMLTISEYVVLLN